MLNDFGKMFFIFHLFVFMSGYAHQIETTLLQLNGEPLEQIIKSQPFIFQVNADVSESFNVPKLVLPAQARSQLVSTNIITKNGKARARYQFQVHIDALGTYRIGPAVLQTSTGELVSDSTFVEVVETSSASPSSIKTVPAQKQEGAFVRLISDKTDFFVGEKIEARVRFYYKESFLECEELREPVYDKASGIKLIAKSNPTAGIEKIDGVTYKFYEWTFSFSGSIVGKTVLNPYRVDYSVGNTPSIFDLIGISSRVSKSTYSNEIPIEIHPLPASSIKTDVVGRLSSFTAQLSPVVVHQGQATTLRLELVGDLVDISDIPLKGMDTTLKIYPSVKTLEKRAGQVAHIFEYVIQPKVLGDYTIPAQQFSFFNPDSYKYQTLSTQELHFSVIESSGNVKSHEHSAPEKVEVEQPIAIALYHVTHTHPIRSLNDSWFFMILGILVTTALILTGVRMRWYPFKFISSVYGRIQARRWVIKEIKQAYRQKRYEHLHAILHEYAMRLAQLYNVKPENIFKVVGKHVSHKVQSRFHTFVDQLERTTFSGKLDDVILSQTEVVSWLTTIDRGMRRESK